MDFTHEPLVFKVGKLKNWPFPWPFLPPAPPGWAKTSDWRGQPCFFPLPSGDSFDDWIQSVYAAEDALLRKSGNGKLLTDALLDHYLRGVVPGGATCLGQPYHLLGADGWPRAQVVGDDLPLTRLILRRHLFGIETVAVVWPEEVNCIELDIDTKPLKDKPWAVIERSLKERLHAARNALGADRRVEGILWRSSSSGGLRYRILLDDFFPADELRERTVAALDRGGVEVKPGWIEVWPAGSACRLPLGRGSDLVSDADFTPLTGRHIRRGGLRRDPVAAILAFAWLADQHRASPADVFGDFVSSSHNGGPCRIHEDVLSCVAGQPDYDRDARGTASGTGAAAPDQKERGRRVGRAQPATTNPPGTYRAKIEAAKHGVSAKGQRFDDSLRKLWDLYVAQRMSREDTLSAYEEWLRTGDHDSKDLAADNPKRERVIARMLRDAPGYLDHLDEGIAAGRITPGLARKRRGSGGVNITSSIVRHRAASGRRWRMAVKVFLLPADRDLLAAIDDRWLREHLGVLLALLREAVPGSSPFPESIPLSRKALQTLAGGKKRRNRDGEMVLGYKYMKAEARRLGILGRRLTFGHPSRDGSRGECGRYELGPVFTGTGNQPAHRVD